MNEKQDRRARGPVFIALLIFFAACGVSLDFLVRQSQVLAVDGDGALKFSSPLKLETAVLPSSAAPVDPFAVIDPAPPEASSLEASSLHREPASVELDAPTPAEDLKISLDASKWKGAPQLLPSPMYVSQISDKPTGEIRGGGWLVIDIANSRVLDVELFKSKAENKGRRVVEAKYLNGERAVDPYNAGFPIVRGIKDLHAGPFEVFENPPCLVRAMNVSEEEICEVVLRGARFRYKFSPPGSSPEDIAEEFPMAQVAIEVRPGTWKKIGAFNESFQPVGDPNHDGIPDFYAESVTSANESGHHTLLLSREANDDVEYRTYQARFQGTH